MTGPAQRPSVGHAVHYVARGSADGRFAPACRAATVTEVAEDGSTVGLCAINPSGLFFHPLEMGGVAEDQEGQTGGTWHWPERVGS